MQIDIRADIREAQRFLTNLKTKAVKQAAARAINDTITTVRAEGARAIKREHPALKIGDIKDAMTTKRAHWANLRGMVATSGTPLSLKLFGATGGQMTKRGTVSPVRARIGQKRAVMQYQGRKAFLVKRWPNDVYVRTLGKGRRLRRLKGPSMPGVFRARGEEFVAMAFKRWGDAFRSRLQYEIARAKR